MAAGRIDSTKPRSGRQARWRASILVIVAAVAGLWLAAPVAAQQRSERSVPRPPVAALAPLPDTPGASLSAASEGRTVLPLDPILATKLQQTGDLTLQDAPLGETLLQVSGMWGVNLIAGVAVDGRVTAVFKQAPLHEILDTLLLSNGYSYRPVGSSLVILKLEDVGNWSAVFETAVIPLTRSDPKDLLESARLLNSPRGKTQIIESARVLLVVDYPEQVAAIRRFAEDMDVAASRLNHPLQGNQATLEVLQFKPQYAHAGMILNSVQAVLSAAGKAAVVDVENRLIVADTPFHLELVRRVMAELDVPRPQVRITALIYDVSLQDMEKLGLNWGSALKLDLDPSGVPGTTLGFDSITQAAAVPGDPTGLLTLTTLSRHINLGAVVQALHKASDSRLLANPNVTVLENEPATIAIVTEIPYQQLTETQQGGSIGTTAFREAGVKLEVIPQIAADGTVQMLVTPSFSRLAGYTPGDQPQPIIDRREAKTTVRVANMQTFVLGGLRQRSDMNDYNGIPYLKDIKYIGHLFRSRHSQMRESELLVFIRPEIIHPCAPMSAREQAAGMLTDTMLDEIPPAKVPGITTPGVCSVPVASGCVTPSMEVAVPAAPPAEISVPAADGPPLTPVPPVPAAPLTPPTESPSGGPREVAAPPAGQPITQALPVERPPSGSPRAASRRSGLTEAPKLARYGTARLPDLAKTPVRLPPVIEIREASLIQKYFGTEKAPGERPPQGQTARLPVREPPRNGGTSLQPPNTSARTQASTAVR